MDIELIECRLGVCETTQMPRHAIDVVSECRDYLSALSKT